MLSAQKFPESAGAFLLLINEAIDVLPDLFDSRGGGKAPLPLRSDAAVARTRVLSFLQCCR